ncbi:hypothetical protein PR048_019455 [Dryococelus australis]|uniref:Uncharacterized protein n=1 Tax=Dryococelus australis TaxID=614101 RepID=A0ABQ9H3J5_9NEOP|nr:hypothetical protein PR048_019455 [Dryococelus australis]
MEHRRNERAGETGDPRENPPTNGIARHDSHMRKSGVTGPGIKPRSPCWEASRLTTVRPPPRRTGLNPPPGHRGSPRVGIVPDDAVGRRVFSGISRFPLLFIPALLHISIALIGFQDLDAKSRPNLFTLHSMLVLDSPGLTVTCDSPQRSQEWRLSRSVSDPETIASPHDTSAWEGGREDTRRPCTISHHTVNLIASHQGDPDSIPGRVIPGFRMWESCRTMQLVGGFSPVYSALSFRRCSILISLTIIASQDLDAVSLLASHQCDPGSIPGWVTPDFRKWELCRTMRLVGRSRRSPVSPGLSFRRCSILTSITLIGSQDPAVKSRPNLFTHAK